MVELGGERYPINPPSEVRAVQGWMALDLWCALGLPSERFETHINLHGWADTWATLLAEVRAVGRVNLL